MRGILISTTRQITLIEHSINRSHIELFLPRLSAYLNPKDYQNVSAAVILLHDLSNIKSSTIEPNKLSKSLKKEIELLSIIVEKFLILFVKPSSKGCDQTKDLYTEYWMRNEYDV